MIHKIEATVDAMENITAMPINKLKTGRHRNRLRCQEALAGSYLLRKARSSRLENQNLDLLLSGNSGTFHRDH